MTIDHALELGWNLADDDVASGATKAVRWTDEQILAAAAEDDRPITRADLPAVRAAYRVAFAEMAFAEGVAS